MSKPRYRPTETGDWREVKARGRGFAVRVYDADDSEDYEPHPESPEGIVRAMNSGRRSAPDAPPREVRSLPRYWSFADFCRDVVTASNPEPGPEAKRAAEKLRAAALTTVATEGIGQDGGFAVPAEFRAAILSKVTGEESLMGRCDVVETAAPSASFPKDETTPWGGTGIKGYWEGEAKAMPQSRPILESSTVKIHKLTALVPVTDELLEDAPALAGHITKKGAEAIDFRVTDAIVNGTGAGQPLGIMNSAHKVEVAKETSQVAATIHGLNLVKMWSRMPPAWRKDAVWLAHPDVEQQLPQAGLQIANPANTVVVGGGLVYIAPGGISGQPYGTLFGRPVIPCQACQALGTAGDLIFASLPQYGILLRTPGLRSQTSIHLWFDQGVTAFKLTLRVGGQPWWSAPITDKSGGNTRSAFVTLATRS